MTLMPMIYCFYGQEFDISGETKFSLPGETNDEEFIIDARKLQTTCHPVKFKDTNQPTNDSSVLFIILTIVYQAYQKALEHISGLLTKVAQYTVKNTTLKTENAALKNDKVVLTTENTTLKNEKATLLNEKVALTTENTTLKNRLETQTKELMILRAIKSRIDQANQAKNNKTKRAISLTTTNDTAVSELYSVIQADPEITSLLKDIKVEPLPVTLTEESSNTVSRLMSVLKTADQLVNTPQEKVPDTIHKLFTNPSARLSATAPRYFNPTGMYQKIMFNVAPVDKNRVDKGVYKQIVREHIIKASNTYKFYAKRLLAATPEKTNFKKLRELLLKELDQDSTTHSAFFDLLYVNTDDLIGYSSGMTRDLYTDNRAESEADEYFIKNPSDTAKLNSKLNDMARFYPLPTDSKMLFLDEGHLYGVLCNKDGLATGLYREHKSIRFYYVSRRRLRGESYYRYYFKTMNRDSGGKYSTLYTYLFEQTKANKILKLTQTEPSEDDVLDIVERCFVTSTRKHKSDVEYILGRDSKPFIFVSVFNKTDNCIYFVRCAGDFGSATADKGYYPYHRYVKNVAEDNKLSKNNEVLDNDKPYGWEFDIKVDEKTVDDIHEKLDDLCSPAAVRYKAPVHVARKINAKELLYPEPRILNASGALVPVTEETKDNGFYMLNIPTFEYSLVLGEALFKPDNTTDEGAETIVNNAVVEAIGKSEFIPQNKKTQTKNFSESCRSFSTRETICCFRDTELITQLVSAWYNVMESHRHPLEGIRQYILDKNKISDVVTVFARSDINMSEKLKTFKAHMLLASLFKNQFSRLACHNAIDVQHEDLPANDGDKWTTLATVANDVFTKLVHCAQWLKTEHKRLWLSSTSGIDVASNPN